ncbi:MAG: hypothetical protein ABIO70_20185 [Pseudomonadota bacterium]
MLASTLFIALGLLVGCGKKAPPVPAAQPEPAPAPAPAAEPEPEQPEPEVAPAAPAGPAVNVDLQVTVNRADGSHHSGHVWLLERSTDWYGEEDWSVDADDIRLQIDAGKGESKSRWEDLKKVTVSIAKVSESSDCTYDSNYTPWMYDCTLRNQGQAVTTDGKTWDVTDRHKWRLTFDDGSTEEFWLSKYPARQQDEATVGLDSAGENYDLYIALQDRLREEVKTMVTGITVQAR